MLTKIFSILGLSEKDERIYRATLELGSQPASVIAQRVGLKRVDTYNHLTNLSKRNICKSRGHNGMKHFKACPPDQLLKLIKDRKLMIKEAESQFKTILPSLLKGQCFKNPEVVFYDGRDGAIELFERYYHCKEKLVRFYGSNVKVSRVTGKSNDTEFYIEQRIKNGIKLKQLVPGDDYGKELKLGDPQALRETKFLPENTNPNASLLMYDDELVILVNQEPFLGVSVKSSDIVIMLKEFFDTLWGSI